MSDTDKLIAAIFTAAMCHNKPAELDQYFKTYDEFLAAIKSREAAKAAEEVEAWTGKKS